MLDLTGLNIQDINNRFDVRTRSFEGCFLTLDFYLLQELIGLVRFETSYGLYWFDFYPHEKGITPKRRGMGTIAHVRTLTHVLENFGIADSALVENGSTSWDRKAQLSEMGLSNPRYKFQEYFEKSLEYARKKGLLLMVSN